MTKEFKNLRDITSYIGVSKLNTISKYPSIPTYHQNNQDNTLNETTNVQFNEDDLLDITEKIDGTNARIILFNDDYIIGSREHLLCAKEDRRNYIKNKNKDIVFTNIVSTIEENFLYQFMNVKLDIIGADKNSNSIIIIYGEVYGSNITRASKQYTDNKEISSFRVFDIAEIPISRIDEIKELDRSKLAEMRNRNQLADYSDSIIYMSHMIDSGINSVPVLPNSRSVLSAKRFPTSISDTHNFLKEINPSIHNSLLLGNKTEGKSEGIIVRNMDRTKIVKIRHQDYERHIRITEKLNHKS